MPKVNCGHRKILLVVALSIAQLATRPAYSADQDNNVEGSGLFHDQGPMFINTIEPDKQTETTVKFRAYKNDLSAASIKYFDSKDSKFRTVSLKKDPDETNAIFDYWRGTIPAGLSKKYYRFQLTDGSKTVWYNAVGPSDNEPTSGDFFVIPGFKTPDWLKNGIIYQIFPDRFFNGKKENDVQNGSYTHANTATVRRNWADSPKPAPGEDQSMVFYGGDLAGIIEKLSYINKTVGANIIYLNPIFKAPSNHKYDTADFDIVDPAFGTNEDLVKLSSAIHDGSSGVAGRLVLDGVFNHTGDAHKWFGKWEPTPGVVGAYQSETSPYRSFYSFTQWPKKYAHFMTYDSLPKLNFGSAALRKQIFESPGSVAMRYLDQPYGIDGWRLDAPKYADEGGKQGEDAYNHSIWRRFRNAVKTKKSDAAILGELWENAKDWTASGDQWDCATNFDGFTQPVSQWITGKNYTNEPASLSVSGFDKWLRLTRATYPTCVQQAMSNHLSNHDITRFGDRAGGDIGKTYLGLFFQMTYVGVPTIYYGDEYGMSGGADPDNRRTMDWTVATEDNKAIALCRKLAAIRNKYTALRTGSFMTLHIDDANKTYGFARMDKRCKIAVLLNNDSREHTVELPVTQLDLKGEAKLTDEISGKTFTVSNGKVSVPLDGHYGAILVAPE
jgi:alpha-glucosidase